MRTWHVELAVVVAVLSAVALASGSARIQWVGVIAVALSFAHGQVAERLAEREAARERPDVDCHRWALRYFVAKETCWCFYFVALGAWTALAGVALFLVYPVWRRWWRSRRRTNGGG